VPPGLLCDLLWSDPEKDIVGWGENDRGVSFTFGPDVVASFLKRHDLDLICRAHQVCMWVHVFVHVLLLRVFVHVLVYATEGATRALCRWLRTATSFSPSGNW
jgi:hypothetical protein